MQTIIYSLTKSHDDCANYNFLLLLFVAVATTVAITVSVTVVVTVAVAIVFDITAAAVMFGLLLSVVEKKKQRHHPASSIILITSKLYQMWYTPSNVGGALDDTPDTDGVVAGQQMRTTTVGRERVCACLLC